MMFSCSALEVKEIAGSSTLAPLVFLHEGLGSVAMWSSRSMDWPLAVCHATGRAGLLYSRLGYGKSDTIPDVRGAHRLGPDYMHREAWDVLPALLKTHGIEQPVLLGHSDGATIALLHAARYTVTATIAMAPHLWVEDISLRSITAAKKAFETGDLRQKLSRYTRMLTLHFGNGTMFGCPMPFEVLTFAKHAKTSQHRCLPCKGWTICTAVCGISKNCKPKAMFNARCCQTADIHRTGTNPPKASNWSPTF